MSERTIANAKGITENAETNEFKVPELLAPVGGRLQLEAAVNNGADAVYMGGSLFNARMRAENFGAGQGPEADGKDQGSENWGLQEAIAYAHMHGVKVYITLNTLIKDRELEKAFDYACSLYEMGADAVILQDMGLARLIHKYLPDFPMHLSTQGTVYNESGARMAAELGFSRVVPARECSLEDITGICRAGLEVEVFVHGALCMCYSGQCQMSRLLGGGSPRSGNRGLCAQPCRLQYKDDRGLLSYALSPKDICTLDNLPELIEAGVDSFKIEGRLKSPEYVAVVTRIYRKYLDLYAKAGHYEVEEADRRMLLQIFNRGGFTEGYLHENPGRDILSGKSPKNQGIPVGRLVAVRPVKAGGKARNRGRGDTERWLADVKLFKGESISMGDGVELESCGNVVTYLEKLSAGLVRIGDFKAETASGIRAGETVYKVTDKALGEAALKAAAVRRIPVDMEFTGEIGKAACLRLHADGRLYEAFADAPVEKAIKRPADPERIREQLGKLGDTPFEVGSVDVRVDKEAMVPISVINDLRRQAANMALAERCIRRTLPEKAEMPEDVKGECALAEAGTGEEVVLVPLELFMETLAAGDAVDECWVPYVLNVSKGALDSYIAENFEEIVAALKTGGPDGSGGPNGSGDPDGGRGIALGNLGWIREFQKAGVKVYGDYGLNVYNRQALTAFAEEGVEVIEWSDEMSERRMKRLPEIMERIPLMITEHPLASDYLIDRKGVKHDVMKWYSGDKFLIF